MSARCLLLVLAIWSLGPALAAAGKYNQVLSPGDPAPHWEKLPGVDGREYSLADFQNKPLVVVVFTCNSCPYAVDYEDRINQLAQKHDDVAVVAINSNLKPEDNLEAMKQRAAEKKFAFPYLFDASQQTAKAYGAIRTPEFYLLDRERRVVYQGSLDDSSDPAKVEQHYLADAVAAAQAGKAPQITETPPIGCLIRFQRERRK